VRGLAGERVARARRGAERGRHAESRSRRERGQRPARLHGRAVRRLRRSRAARAVRRAQVAAARDPHRPAGARHPARSRELQSRDVLERGGTAAAVRSGRHVRRGGGAGRVLSRRARGRGGGRQPERRPARGRCGARHRAGADRRAREHDHAADGDRVPASRRHGIRHREHREHAGDDPLLERERGVRMGMASALVRTGDRHLRLQGLSARRVGVRRPAQRAGRPASPHAVLSCEPRHRPAPALSGGSATGPAGLWWATGSW
jgi:hypothetical protein